MKKPAKSWNGMANKSVFGSYRYNCPICGDEHGGRDEEHRGDRVCLAHNRADYQHLPKKLWHPREYKDYLLEKRLGMGD